MREYARPLADARTRPAKLLPNGGWGPPARSARLRTRSARRCCSRSRARGPNASRWRGSRPRCRCSWGRSNRPQSSTRSGSSVGVGAWPTSGLAQMRQIAPPSGDGSICRLRGRSLDVDVSLRPSGTTAVVVHDHPQREILARGGFARGPAGLRLGGDLDLVLEHSLGGVVLDDHLLGEADSELGLSGLDARRRGTRAQFVLRVLSAHAVVVLVGVAGDHRLDLRFGPLLPVERYLLDLRILVPVRASHLDALQADDVFVEG